MPLLPFPAARRINVQAVPRESSERNVARVKVHANLKGENTGGDGWIEVTVIGQPPPAARPHLFLNHPRHASIAGAHVLSSPWL